MDERIKYVRSFGDALEDVRMTYESPIRVCVRGICASVGGEVDLSFPVSESRAASAFPKIRLLGEDEDIVNGRKTILVKPIAQTVLDGTELSTAKNPLVTRVVFFNGGSATRPEEYASSERIDFYAERAGISPAQRALLKPALLVYDPNLLTSRGRYYAELSADPEVRSRSVLRAYILD